LVLKGKRSQRVGGLQRREVYSPKRSPESLVRGRDLPVRKETAGRMMILPKKKGTIGGNLPHEGSSAAEGLFALEDSSTNKKKKKGWTAYESHSRKKCVARGEKSPGGW